MTLPGIVPWQYQKGAAEKAVAHLYGIKGVANAIVVKAPVTAANVRQKIEKAFKRSADIDAQRVSVHSLSERSAAEHTAWAAPGVIAVDDRLVIAP